MRRLTILCAGVMGMALASLAGGTPAFAGTFVYVSNAEDGDISTFTLKPDGELQAGDRVKAASVVMPMAVSPDRRFLYAASRSKPFSVHVYAIDPATGGLKPLATSPLAESFPYISLDRTGRFLFAYGIDRVGFVPSLGYALGGYLLWTLAEYWIHRVIFHFEPEDGIGARLHWMVHGVHHDHPNDPLRLVMPPAASVPLALVFYAAFYVVLGADRAFAFGAGFLAGYLAYDMIHYALHHHTPRTRMGKWLRELHMRHHFQDDERGFGISAPYWDRVFGTMHVRRGR